MTDFFCRQIIHFCVKLINTERVIMKYIKALLFAIFFVPTAVFGASTTGSSDFMLAAQLLAAAKNADIQQVQALVNNGADINFVDSTGLSIVCTALMNNDVRAAQILQMYGADASNCDRQIKQYESKNSTESSGGLFSGLSSAQNISLAAAGAAVVVGGLFLLTDVLDPGNNNVGGGTSSDGTRPGGDGSGGGTGNATAAFTIPYGPAMPNAESETANYITNLNLYSPSTTGVTQSNFDLMTDTYGQNYLLMMHGYSPLARGYMGMRTLRNSQTYAPISLSGNNLGTDPVMGGRPVNVALVTANGVNSSPKPAGALTAENNSLDDEILLWTTLNNNGTSSNGASNEMISSKYYNNKIITGTDTATVTDDSTIEDSSLLSTFDLSGFGTAINNVNASSTDNLIAKIVGGANSGFSTADFIGFMPNGQMTIFRTGGGSGMVALETPTNSGTYTMAGASLAANDTLTISGKTLTITKVESNVITATDESDNVYNGYIGTDGLLYISSTSGGEINTAYNLTGGNLMLTKQLEDIDYYNYQALLNAGNLWAAGDAVSGGRSRPDVIANASVIAPLQSASSATIGDVLSLNGQTLQAAAFINYVNQYYDVNKTDGTDGADALPGTAAYSFFNMLGSAFSPLTIFATGSAQTGTNWIGKNLEASFENSAPLVFNNLEHLFMSVVPVGLAGGTTGTDNVSGFSPKGKYQVSQWSNNNGTPDNASDDIFYKGRVCGIAGSGANGIDPWCFAAAGMTDELAVASAAGAAGVIQGAFYKTSDGRGLSSKELFSLLALTADGAYLATDSAGKAFTEDGLISYLQGMYQMPYEYEYRWKEGGENYLDVFKEVFGYGLINLERATTPGTSIYYYNGSNIVSGDGNAYWRAATNTTFRSSSAFSPSAATISAPFYDLLESIDGELSMPRIWQNEFALGTQTKRGLYMGDVLGDLHTTKVKPAETQFGNLTMSMAISERQYDDYLSGLDSLQFDYESGKWSFGAGYQHHFTDGQSRFFGLSNPVLALASDVIASDFQYNMGRWSFGSRAFSGAITDEGLLENDPTISSQYMPARLGLMQGAQSNISWNGDKFNFTTSVGSVYESDTLLGAQTGGLLNLGNGNTTYIDTELKYKPTENISLTMRSTFAHTTSDASGDFILGMSDIESNAFAFGAEIGNFSFGISAPLAVTSGSMQYAYADYESVENEDGNFDLVVKDTHIENLALSPEAREVRFMGQYRHSLGAWTDAALGFIYRVNPNHTKEFGNESIFMMKVSHRLGI